MSQTLYERLGGGENVARIARDIVALHLANPIIATRFGDSDRAQLEEYVATFIGAGTGGPETYAGRDMATAHKGMNINERELVATFDDVMKALVQNGVGEAERAEMLAILYSMKDDVMFQ